MAKPKATPPAMKKAPVPPKPHSTVQRRQIGSAAVRFKPAAKLDTSQIVDRRTKPVTAVGGIAGAAGKAATSRANGREAFFRGQAATAQHGSKGVRPVQKPPQTTAYGRPEAPNRPRPK